jgi:hypothetical protein
MEEAQTTPPNLDTPLLIIDRVTELTGADRAVLFLPDDRRPERLRGHMLPHLLPPCLTHFLKARALWFGIVVGADCGESFLTPYPASPHELPGIGDPVRVQGDLPLYRMIC